MALDLLRLARQLAGHNKMAIGDSIKRVLPSGTSVSIINKGKGIFEKVIQKVDGTEFHSIFRKAEFLRMDGKNARGTWAIVPQKITMEDCCGDIVDIRQFKISTTVKGLHRPSATYTKTPGVKGFDDFEYIKERGWGILPDNNRMVEQGPEWAELTHDYLIKNIKTATLRVLKAFGRY